MSRSYDDVYHTGQHNYGYHGDPPHYGPGSHLESHDNRQMARNNRVEQAPRPKPKGKNFVNPLIKYLLFFFNFFFWLVGGAAIGASAWLLLEKENNINDVLDAVFDPVILLCIAGCLIFILGFFGCLGSLRENICLLKCFRIIMIVLMVVLIAFAVLVMLWYFVPTIRASLSFLDPEPVLKQAVIKYRDNPDLKDTIDNFQKTLQCCGVSDSDTGYKDWQINVYFNCSESSPSPEKCGVPFSCCLPDPETTLVNIMCGYDTTNKDIVAVSSKIYTTGCIKAFGVWLQTNVIIIGGGFLGVIIPMMVGICLSGNLIDQIEAQKRQWRR